MRRISFLTIHPDFIDEYKKFGVLARCESLKLAEINSVNLRDFAVDKRGSVDAAPYGGGEGMILRPEPLRDAIESLDKAKVIYTSPSGKAWNQSEAQKLANSGEDLIFVCGRFGGVDQRFIDKYVDSEYSLGDFVISGGELACLTMADSVIREIEGSLGNYESVKNDSFAEGMNGLLEYPLYTRPEEFEGQKVPDVLKSGDHKKIAKWREEKALERTKNRRPDLLK